MKKFVVLLAAVCFLFVGAGNALADFTYGDNSSLALSVYNEATNVETGYDLGIIGDTLDLSYAGYLTTIDVSDLDATVSLYSTMTGYTNLFGLTTETATGINSTAILNFNSAVRSIWNVGYENGSSPVTIDASDVKSASTLLSDTGSYAGLVMGGTAAYQPSLETLNSGDLYIYLYQYDVRDLNTGFDANTDYTAVLIIQQDGDVYLNEVAAVPVPAAVWLLGSGLLGLVGIRRRNS
ncbi:hypothetical protein DSCO28_64040 [Desulfosarcina ovata subsp. sediminis]|uniref:PEP-CTERM protein-sorting domain-containing protein n=1 Tax=Desulfosarcina ovata subsp. sediminis TaxID=885957 RepID=A0A5K8A060_9BACT|nr:VPLPA-CTERM sorting domain-containing protein [Desulfosarcina ovata]BBO85838.1 hypothetical protein DSCO28_64040 [Desulfosarcina ovata subsp. sediminis]